MADVELARSVSEPVHARITLKRGYAAAASVDASNQISGVPGFEVRPWTAVSTMVHGDGSNVGNTTMRSKLGSSTPNAQFSFGVSDMLVETISNQRSGGFVNESNIKSVLTFSAGHVIAQPTVSSQNGPQFTDVPANDAQFMWEIGFERAQWHLSVIETEQANSLTVIGVLLSYLNTFLGVLTVVLHLVEKKIDPDFNEKVSQSIWDTGTDKYSHEHPEETERNEESLREDAPSHRRSPGNSYVSAIAETYPAIAAPSEDDTEKALLNNDSAKGSRSETGSAYGTQAPSAEAEQPDVVRK